MLTFKSIEKEDIAKLQTYFGLRSNETCDSTLFDTFLLDRDLKGRCAVTEEALFFCYEDEGLCCAAAPLCLPGKLPAAMKELERYYHEELGQKLVLSYVDEVSKALLEPLYPAACWEELTDYADYIYDGEALRTLAGKKYHKKKNHVNAFLRKYEGRFEYAALSEADYEEIREFLGRWASARESVDADLERELEGLKTALQLLTELKACCGGVRVDGRLEAMTIGSLNERDDMAIIHVEKANPEIDGLYTYINQTFLQRVFPTVRYVNREDDVGLPALRKAKESYHPVRMARKWIMREV